MTPTGFLPPGREFTLRVEGGWAGDGRSGAVADTIRFRTAKVRPPRRRRCARAAPSRLSRLAVPLPPILPSLNQIGFDSYDMVVGALRVSPPDANGEGSLLLWAVSTKRGPGGATTADRRGAFAFPLQGRYRDDSLLLSQRGLSLTFSFGDVPLRRFDLRMQMGRRPARPRRQPDGRGLLPRGARLRPGADRDRPLQQRLDPALERHLHHRSLPRARQRAPARGAPGEPRAASARPPPTAGLGGRPARRSAAARRPPRRRDPAHGRRHRRCRVARLPQGDFTKVGARSHQSGEAAGSPPGRASRAASGHT